MIRAVVFDMDGILFDTERMSVEGWRETAAEMGFGDMEEGIYGCIGLNRTDCRNFLLKTYGADFPYETFREKTADRFEKRMKRDGLPIMKGAPELLEWLSGQPVKLALASSTHTASVKSHLERAGFTDYFQAVIGGDMVEHSKPRPDIYRKACALLEVKPEEAVAVEDSPNGIRSAHAAGMLPIMVPDLVKPTEEIRQMLYAECGSLSGVRDLLEERLGVVKDARYEGNQAGFAERRF